MLPTTLVRSYRTFSTLPVTGLATRPSAVYFLLHEMLGFPDLAFTSTLSCEVPTFLNVAVRAQQHCGRPTDSPLVFSVLAKLNA